MKKTNKKLLGILIVFLIGSVSVFAGGKQDSSGSGGKITEKKEVAFWSLDARDPERSVVEGIVNDFNESNDSITVNTEFIESEGFKMKIKVAVAGNDMPDVFTYWTGGQFKAMVDANVIADLTDIIKANPDFENRFLEGSFDVMTYDGRIYGIPNLASTVVIWYNKEIFDRYNLKIPITWNQLLQVVDTLKENGEVPITVAGKDRWPLLHWFSYLSQRIGGVEPFNEIVKGQNDFTDPSFIKAAYMLRELESRGGFMNGYLGMDYGGAESQFTSGNAAMYMQGDWAVGSLATNPEISDKVGFFKFPEVTGGVGNPNIFQGGLGGCIAISSTADLESAFEFIKYYKQPEVVKPLVEAIGRPSAVKIDFSDSTIEPLKAEYLNFFSETPEGFFGYYDQQLDPQTAEKILNAVQAILGDPSLDIESELAKVK